MTEYDLHRARTEAYTAMRDREPDPLPLLREQVRELAERQASLCALLRSDIWGAELDELLGQAESEALLIAARLR